MRKEKKHFPNLKIILGLVFGFTFLIFIAPRVLAADCTLVNATSTCPPTAKSVYITGNFSDTVIYPGQSFTATGDKMMVKVTSTSFTVSGATEITYDRIESNGKEVSLSGQKITPDSGSIVTGVSVGQQGDSGDVTITMNEIGSSNDWINDINTAGFDANAGNVTITAKFINMGDINAFSECWDINNCQDPYNKTFGNAGQITVNGAVIFLPANLKVHGLQPTSINIEATNVIDAANITTYGGCKQKKVVDGRTFCAECTASGSVTLSASKFVGVSSINTSSGSAETGRAGDITINSSGSWIDADGIDKAGAEIGSINATGLPAGSVTINGKNVKIGSIDVSSSDPEAFPEEIVGFTGSGAGQVSISASQDLSFTGPIYAIGKYPFAPDGGNVSLTAGRRLGIYSPGGEIDVSSNNLRDKWNFSWGFPWYVINGVTVGVCDGTKPYLSGTNAGVKTDGTDTGHGDGPRGGNGGAITISAKEIPLPNDGSDWITLWLFANGGWGSPGGNGGSATYCEPYAGDKDVMPIYGFGGKGGSGGSGGTINLNISDVSCLSKIDLRAKAGGGGDAGSHGSLPGYSPEYTTREDNKCPLQEWQGKAVQARLMSPEAGIGGIGGVILVRAPQGSYAQDGGPMIIKDAQASVEGGRGGNSVSSNTGPYPFYCTSPSTPGNVANSVFNTYFQDPNCYDEGGAFICQNKIPQTPCQSQAFTSSEIECRPPPRTDICWAVISISGSGSGFGAAQARAGAFSGRNGANGGLAGSIDICTNLIPGGSTCSFSAKGGSGAGGARGQDAFISQPGIGGAGGAGRKGGSIIVPDANSFVNDENITGGIGGDGGEGGQAAMMQLPTADGFCAVIHSGFPTDPASTWDTYFADWGRLCGEGEVYEDGCCYYAGALKSCRTNDSPEYFFGVMSNYTSVTGANGVGNGNDNKGSRSSGPLCVTGLICEPQLIIKPTPPPPNETGCCDGIDNDFDGFLDCQDSDCGSECFDPGGLLIGETVETWQTKCGVVICDDSQNNDPNYDNDIDLNDETNCKKCGNGVLDEGEECDLGGAAPGCGSYQKCVNCQCINYCGNGRVDTTDLAFGAVPEECDTDADCVSLYGSDWECINPGQPNECQCQEVPNTQPDIDTTTNPPTATQTNQNTCSPSPIIRFTWQYEDSDNVPPSADPQSAYEIQIDDDSDVTASPLITLSGGSESSREYSGLNFNTQYWWRIRVRDTNGPEWSNWANGNSFTTSSPLPVADFTFTPANPVVGEQVQFTNNTNCPVSPCTYNWTFQDGNPATSILVNPLVTFNSEGQKSVTLIATDSLGRSCDTGTVTKNIPVGPAIPILPNPKWKEILPF